MKKYLNERSMCIHNNEYMSPRKWFDNYVGFQRIYPQLVHISKFDEIELSFEMEKIEGFVLSDLDTLKTLSIRERRNIASSVIILWGKIYNFTISDKFTFIHKDFCVNNLMYDTKNRQVRLIDPDSFNIVSPSLDHAVFFGPFIDTIYNMKQWEKL